jgi:hypothetical protein
MRGTSTRRIHSGEVEGDRPRVLYIWPMDLLQLLCIVFLQNRVKYEDNKYCVRIKTNSYQPLHRICVTLMCRLPNIEVMRFDPSTFLLQHIIK